MSAPRRTLAAVLLLTVVVVTACGQDGPTVRAATPTSIAKREVAPRSVVPRIDAALQARLLRVVAAGRSQGSRAGVFAKVGDSITASPDFLVPIGCGAVDYGRWSVLAATVARWSATVPHGWLDPGCPAATSFTRVGASAAPGWRVADLVRPRSAADALCQPVPTSAIDCELAAIRPSLALVEIGSNDLVTPDGEHVDPAGLHDFEPGFRQLVRTIVAHGVVPVVSTVPPRHRPPEAEPLVAELNDIVVRVAGEEHVPVWDYWLALQSSSQFGMAYDWVHPSPAPTGAGDLRDAAMDWGYNVRNRTALQVLAKLTRVVFDGGRADA
jgi:hypothetical protein